MKNLKLKIMVLFLLIFQIVSAQYFERSPYSGAGLPYFESKIIQSIDSSKTNISIYIQILNDDLSFVKKDSFFRAEYEVTLLVIKQNNIIFNKIVNKEIIEEEFDNTNDRKNKKTMLFKINLQQGDYIVDVQVKDVITGQKLKRDFNIKIPDLKNNLLIASDILFYDKIKVINNEITKDSGPNVLQNLSNKSNEFYANFKTYIKDSSLQIKVSYILQNENGKIDKEQSYDVIQNKQEMEHWIKIDRKELPSNKYSFNLEISYKDKSVEKSSIITFFWHDAPNSLSDLDLAIEEMFYILPSDSLKKLKKLGLDEKRIKFKKYWKVLDPDSSTEINELMEEYYKRINLVNRKYSNNFTLGWKTDMGRIYIKFGPPDEVTFEKMPLNSYPWEIWKYYELNKTFLFVGDGFGNFELHRDYLNVEYE